MMKQIMLTCLLAGMLAATSGCGLFGGYCCGPCGCCDCDRGCGSCCNNCNDCGSCDCCTPPRCRPFLGLGAWRSSSCNNCCDQCCCDCGPPCRQTGCQSCGNGCNSCCDCAPPCRQTGCQSCGNGCNSCCDSCCGCCDDPCCCDGCCERPWHRGPLSCFFGLLTPRCWGGPSCGQRYWGDYYSDPPCCCDPCDCHGNYNGCCHRNCGGGCNCGCDGGGHPAAGAMQEEVGEGKIVSESESAQPHPAKVNPNMRPAAPRTTTDSN